MDTGLACYLSLWNNPRALERSAMAGSMFETYVIDELVKLYSRNDIITKPHKPLRNESVIVKR